MNPEGNRKLDVGLNHNVQQYAVACVHRVVVRWDPCGDIVHNPPGNQIRSVDLCAKKPLVVVSVNGEIGMLETTRICLIRAAGGEKIGTCRMLAGKIIGGLRRVEGQEGSPGV